MAKTILDFEKPIYEKALLLPKGTNDNSVTAKHLLKVKEILENNVDWSAESIKNDLWDYASEVGRGNVLWPLRTCLTGRDKSPDPFTVAEVLGKTETLSRVGEAINQLNI